jgi:DNA-binding NarL/FixJ family response regulator
MENIKIAIVEDQRLFREGIHSLLKETHGMDIVAVAENGLQFLEILENGILPDVALVDMNMPELNGFELVEIMVKRFPSVKCIILTVYNQERFIVKMIEAGVAGYLVKNCRWEYLLQ